MTIETPLWMQGGTYPARIDRQLLAGIFDEGILGAASFAVAERGAGANFSVDVAAGVAVIEGDDQANQGNYLVVSTVTENVAVSAAPGSNSRYDIVVLQINDPTAGGASGNSMTIEVIAGTPSATPSPPAVPDSALLIATIGPITTGTASITDSIITDEREHAPLAHPGVIAAGSLGTDELADDAVTRAKISAAAVGSTELDSAIPLGPVGYAQRTTSQSVSTTTETAITSMSVTFTAVAGRRYRIRFHCPALDSSAGPSFVRLKDGSTVVQSCKPNDSAVAPAFTLEHVTNASLAGSKTFAIFLKNVLSGTTTLYAIPPTESVGVMSLLVEDIGAL